MAPIPPRPKVVLYHQTHHTPAGDVVSLLPLLGATPAGGRPSVTHVVVAALHINEDPEGLTLNDHAPDHARFDALWAEVRACQAAGVRVLALLGGAAPGSFARLDIAKVTGDDFERYYGRLLRLLRARRLDGLDLDVEEPTSLRGIVHLIDRLRADLGPGFLLTAAPVAAALWRPRDPGANRLAGFSYADLEAERGRDIAWYHAQFYCGWGDAAQPHMYAAVVGATPPAVTGGGGLLGTELRIPAERVVMGLLTNPDNGPGFVPLERTAEVVLQLQALTGGRFAGVSGWEYFNALPGGAARPWEWAEWMTAILGGHQTTPDTHTNTSTEADTEADPDADDGAPAPVPAAFDYYTDGEA